MRKPRYGILLFRRSTTAVLFRCHARANPPLHAPRPPVQPRLPGVRRADREPPAGHLDRLCRGRGEPAVRGAAPVDLAARGGPECPRLPADSARRLLAAPR